MKIEARKGCLVVNADSLFMLGLSYMINNIIKYSKKIKLRDSAAHVTKPGTSMKPLLLFFLLQCSLLYVLGQVQSPAIYNEPGTKQKIDKPIIDSAAISNWPSLGEYVSISSNGKYVAYTICNQPFNNTTLVIQSTLSSWKKEIVGASPGFFSCDSKQYTYMAEDTLCFLHIDANRTRKISGVVSHQYPPRLKGIWLAWQLKDKPDVLIVHNLLTTKELQYSSVLDYVFNETEKALVLKLTDRKGSVLQLVRLPEGEAKNIWSSEIGNVLVSNITIDAAGDQVVFTLQDTPTAHSVSPSGLAIWYYKTGMLSAERKVDKTSPGMDSGFTIHGDLGVNDDGRYIFFTLQQKALPQPVPDAVKLDIWHYRDTILQCTQLSQQDLNTYQTIANIETGQVIRLQQDFEISKVPPKGDLMVFSRNSMGDRFWLNQQDTNWLVSLQNGARKLLKTVGECTFWFSPGGKYLVYYDAGQQHNYFSYDLTTGLLTNISSTVPVGDLGYINEYCRPDWRPPRPVGVAAWLKNDSGLLVYANYDIWQLDLSGRKAPVNVTNAYGRTHHIKFRLANEEYNLTSDADDTLLLSAFNMRNKQNGFFRKSLGRKENPELLVMDDHVLTLWHNLYAVNDHDYSKGMKPLKAGNADIWIVMRQSNGEAPNYFITNNFKNYKPLSNLRPQKSFNWLTAELIHFKQLDGTTSEGILYKPENFDPTKKYPVLFNYYEQLSHRLNQFPIPSFTRSNINVPWFVSRGYLVFTPDIHFMEGRRGKSAFNTVVGAANYLCSLPYVDGKKMAINGHSVGGGLTNYIITHTNLFAAAIEGAGVSDILSSALQISSGVSRLGAYGKDVLANHEILLEDSPIMNVDKVSTPLIIFHSKSDGAVPWEQAVELYIALRRLGKKCWMLQYDEGNHGVWLARDYKDYTIRITQFFDHYLKGMAPPKWMTQGIPAKLKGFETGYELDTSGRQP